MAILEIYGS